MASNESQEASIGLGAGAPHIHAAKLKALMQSLLTTLVDTDLDYDRMREKLRTAEDNHSKTRALKTLEEKHRAQREPQIQQLAILQERIDALLRRGRRET